MLTGSGRVCDKHGLSFVRNVFGWCITFGLHVLTRGLWPENHIRTTSKPTFGLMCHTNVMLSNCNNRSVPKSEGECFVGNVYLTLLIMALSIAGLLAIGSFFLQNFFYTEPSTGLVWQVPVATAVMAVFYLLWCVPNMREPGAGPNKIPYGSIFSFSPDVDMYPEPVKKLWVKRPLSDELEEYQKLREPIGNLKINQIKYQKLPLGTLWNPEDVEAVIIKYKDEEIRFVPQKLKEREEGAALEFHSPEGWRMKVNNRMIDGNPTRSNTAYFLGVLLLNFTHLVLWFVCLWLILRFQFFHAMLLSLGLWVAATLFVVPMLLADATKLAPPDPATVDKLTTAASWIVSFPVRK